jgi:uncharacterized RDD family membrane protein YckC
MPAKGVRNAAIEEGRKFSRSLVTPEGVDLGVKIATAGERAGAFVIDAIIIMLTMIGLSIVVSYAAADSRTGLDVVAIVWLVAFFVIRNFYFFLFEVGARAATPGKRILKIRVASRGGGLLRADAIFARNAMREVEVFLPLSFLAASGASVDGWIQLAGLIWAAIFVFFPLFNRDRLRAGDIIAGTWVVQAPRKALLADLSTRTLNVKQPQTQFSQEQLEVYGIKELHVLEDVLRAGNRDALQVVAERIRKKIGWTKATQEADAVFLNDYYRALRKNLEARILMGVRKADKHDKAR